MAKARTRSEPRPPGPDSTEWSIRAEGGAHYISNHAGTIRLDVTAPRGGALDEEQAIFLVAAVLNQTARVERLADKVRNFNNPRT